MNVLPITLSLLPVDPFGARGGAPGLAAASGVPGLRAVADSGPFAGLFPSFLKREAPEAAVHRLARQVLGDAWIRALLAEEPEAQIVVLDAGTDMTACRIGAERRPAGCTPGRFFELDLAPAIAAKHQHLDALKRRQAIHDRHVARIAFDPARVSLAKALLDAGFDRTLPTLWVSGSVMPVDAEPRLGYRIADMRALSAAGSRLCIDVATAGAGPGAIGRWLGEHGWTLEQSVDAHDMAFIWEDKVGEPAPAMAPRGQLLCVAMVR